MLFAVLGLVLFHTKPRDWFGEMSDLFCVEWDVKAQFSQSSVINFDKVK